MNITIVSLICLIVGALLGWALVLIRNNAVFRFRITLISEIYDICYKDIMYARMHGLAYPDNGWRWELLDSVPYNKMVFSLKPLTKKAFYGSDTPFLTPPAKTDSLI